MATNAETLGRYAKARKVADILVSAGLDDDALLTDNLIEQALEVAGYAVASAPTRALIRELLRDRVGSAA